jgi:hypothetical protein
MPVLDAIAAATIGLLAIAALAGLRRERREARGTATSRTHPFLIGVYRGLAVVVVALVAVMVANVLWAGSGAAVVAAYIVAVIGLLATWTLRLIASR